MLPNKPYFFISPLQPFLCNKCPANKWYLFQITILIMLLQNSICTSTIRLAGNKKVNPANVLFLKADVNYTELFMQGGKTLIVPKTLKELEKRFIPFNFFRTHKSFMVNLNYVIGYQIHEGLLVKLDGEFNVNLSRRRKEDFLKSFHNFPKN